MNKKEIEAEDDIRLYTFVNHVYLSEKQLGIQTAHLVSTLGHKDLKENGLKPSLYKTWAEKYHTIIMKRGGNCESLHKLITELKARDIPLLYAPFFEDKQSLNGAITGVGIIVPSILYKTPYGMEGSMFPHSQWLFKLIVETPLA